MRIIPSRTTDPVTSHQGEDDVRIRANTQKHKLLCAYWASPGGLTDEEASLTSGVHPKSCWWKRCSELREMGLITDTGNVRMAESGSYRMVCVITSKGNEALTDIWHDQFVS